MKSDPQPSQKGCCHLCRDSYDTNGMPFCKNPQCECHLLPNSEDDGPDAAGNKVPGVDWKERLYLLLEKNIAVDGGAVATKYRYELEDFIESLLTRVREEGYRIEGAAWDAGREAGKAEAYKKAAELVQGWHISKGGYTELAEQIKSLDQHL